MKILITSAVAFLMGVAPVFAQISSRGASVTLRATVLDSFTVQHAWVPMSKPWAEKGEQDQRALFVSLAWNLHPGRTFQIASATMQRMGDELTESPQAPMSLRELDVSSHVFSFMSSAEGKLLLLGASGRGEEEAAGRAVFMMLAPAPPPGGDLTIRISVISL